MTIPAGAEVIDLSHMTVMPGLVEAHNHLALTYKPVPENNVYYYTYVQESTALRAIQAASNGIQMLAAGFTIVRDMVGQFFPTPAMAKDHNIVYPEYLDAGTPDEIVKAIRQNVLFGAKAIKICVDCKPYGYTADEIRLVIREAAKSGMKVEGHVQTLNGARNAIEAGIWSIAHSTALTDEMHKLMAQKGIWRAGTETPPGLEGHPVSAAAYARADQGGLLRRSDCRAWQSAGGPERAQARWCDDAGRLLPRRPRQRLEDSLTRPRLDTAPPRRKD